MRLLRFSEWLLGCCYAAARVPRVVARAVARVPGWLLGCCYAAARVPRAVVRAVSRVPRVVARAVARVPGWCHDAVALKILLSPRDCFHVTIS